MRGLFIIFLRFFIGISCGIHGVIHAGFMRDSCGIHAGFMRDSCGIPAGLAQDSCGIHAGFAGPCGFQAGFMQDGYRNSNRNSCCGGAFSSYLGIILTDFVATLGYFETIL